MNKTKIKEFVNKKEVVWTRIIISAVISAAAVAISSGMSLRTFYSSMMVILCAVVFYAELKLDLDSKQKKFGSIIGFIYANFVIAGSYDIWTNYGFCMPKQNLINFLIVSIGTITLYSSVVKVFVGLLDKWERNRNENTEKYPKFFIPICFIIIFACWFIYFLGYYPGILSYDSIDQFAQIFGVDEYSNHHPLVHTISLKWIYDIAFKFFKNSNVSISVCVLIQMLILDGIFTYMISVLKKTNIKKKYILLCLAFVAIYPVNAFFSITIWKDILFGGVALLMAISFWQIEQIDIENSGKIEKIGLFARFFLVGIIFCLWRSNGFYAYLFCIPFFFLSKSFKKARLWLAVIIFITVASVFLIKGPLMERYEVRQPDFVEHIAVPIQHVARVVVDNGYQNLPAEDLELLSQVVQVEQIPDNYYAHIADGMKNYIRSGNPEFLNEHKKEFFMLWLRWGLKYPDSYLRAQIDITRGYWYPNYNYWVTWETVAPNEFGFYRDSKLPGHFSIFLEAYNTFCKNMPFIEILWEIGFFVWAEIFCIAYALRRRKSILIFLPTIAIFLTLMIATPVAAEFRYGYSFVTCLPFFVGVMFPQLRNQVEQK